MRDTQYENLVMITTTTYGTWLPGDVRGYVENGRLLPAEPTRWRQAIQRLKQPPVFLTSLEQQRVPSLLNEAADEFDYPLTDLAVETWHLHWIAATGPDSVAGMAGRLKNRVRQGLNRGRIWTKSYWCTFLFDESSFQTARRYIAAHPGCCLLNGQWRDGRSTSHGGAVG